MTHREQLLLASNFIMLQVAFALLIQFLKLFYQNQRCSLSKFNIHWQVLVNVIKHSLLGIVKLEL